MIRRPPRSTRTDTLFPYTTLVRSGLEERHHYLIDDAAKTIAVLQTGNTSLGVTLLAHLVREAASRLDPEWDIEILEMHHRNKVDAPSGTALLLGEAAAEGRGIDLARCSERGRDGVTGARGQDRKSTRLNSSP